MRWFSLIRGAREFNRSESGDTLLTTIVALAVIGVVVTAFLGGLGTASKAAIIADEQTTAESLARSQIEWVKKATYVPGATTYSAAPIPGDNDYISYSVAITAAALHTPDDGIQKITVAVQRNSREVVKLDSYKVER